MVASQPERSRQVHAVLAQSVRSLSEGFGLRFLFSIISIGWDKLFNVYVNTYFGQNASSLVFYLGMLDFIWVIYLPAHFSNKLIEEGNAVQDVILKTPTASGNRNDLKYCYQIDMLLEEVRISNLEISAWGVFKIDNGIYGSYFNTLLTFFIAMAGFSPEITAMIERYNLRNT